MARKTKNQRQKQKENNRGTNKISSGRIMQILVVIIAILLLIIVFLTLVNKEEIESENDNIPDRDFLVNNCECVEYNGIRSCPVGFELNNESTLCRNTQEKTITNILISCSKYKCPEYFVDLNEGLDEIDED